MDETPVVTVFLRNRGEVLLVRRSDAVGSYAGLWGAVAGHVADDAGRDRSPEAAARAEIREETGIDDSATTLVRAGESFAVVDADREARWLVHPFLFDCPTRAVETNVEAAAHEWVAPTAILRRETVPSLWTSYDRVRPRVATVRADRTHGSAWLSLRALEVLRDEAALAAVGRWGAERERREASGDDWNALAALARDLTDARPSMAVVTNRVDRAMAAASDERTPAAVEAAASETIADAARADEAAAATAAERLPDRVATLSRSGTALRAIIEAGPEAILVAESRPGREGVAVAESLAGSDEGGDSAAPAVTLTTDAAFPSALDAWDAGALLVGADRILPDGRVVNKVGTRAAALAAPDACDCVVVAAVDKIAPAPASSDDHSTAATDARSPGTTVDLEPRDPTEVYDGDAPVDVVNPTFDVTPAAAFDAVVTERGVLDAANVAAVADAHRERADWD